jgi:ABC-2 type transport system permease protein
MNKVIIIVRKEWAEVFRNKLVLFSVVFLPLIFVALPLISIGVMGGFGDDLTNGGDTIPGAEALCQGLDEMECVQVYTLDIFTMMFMILPIMIPVTIAAYSIVGEKAMRSLEPLLATPITTTELLVGKMTAAAIPAILATWIAYGLYVLGINLMTTPNVSSRLVDPLWLVAVFIAGPLLTIFAVCVAIMVSSRVTDPRVAEQLSGVVLLPIILVLVGQSIGFIILDRDIVLLIAAVVFVADIFFVFLAIRLFERETILTKWK